MTTADPSDRSAPATADRRGTVVGALVLAGFGMAWTAWGAGALTPFGTPAVVVRVVGLALGAVLLVAGVLALRRRPPGTGTSMVGSRRYWVVVVAEGVAIVVGGSVLVRLGAGALVCAWVAAVVGAHFLVFGRLFWRGFLVLGGLLLLAALAGLVLALTGSPTEVVVPTVTLLSATVLYVFSALALRWVR